MLQPSDDDDCATRVLARSAELLDRADEMLVGWNPALVRA